MPDSEFASPAALQPTNESAHGPLAKQPMSSPTFSIVVPVYNKAAYIGETLRSALAQSYESFEVIVVDDGSEDGSPAVVAGFSDPRVKLLRQANGGVSRARNTGVAAAQGQWIAFLDADDLWSPDYLRLQAETIARHPGVRMVATGYCRFPDKTVWRGPTAAASASSADELIRDLPQRWMDGACFFTSSLVVEASFLKGFDTWFPPGESLGEDLDLWFRLAESSEIAFKSDELVGYRVNAQGSLTQAHVFDELPPYLNRMRHRAAQPTAAGGRRPSTHLFVIEAQITYARTSIQQNQRLTGVRWLARSFPGGLSRRRWWVTAAMIFFPGGLVARWQEWRIGRNVRRA